MRYFDLFFAFLPSFIMVLVTTISYSVRADMDLVCQIWFDAQDFDTTNNCALECVTANTGNAYCLDSCVSLCCKAKKTQALLDDLAKAPPQEACFKPSPRPVYYHSSGGGVVDGGMDFFSQKMITAHELWLVIRHPIKMFHVYNLGQQALQVCQSFYPVDKMPVMLLEGSLQNACDHFIWSALLYSQFGLQFSNKVLLAHEENAEQSFSQKLMDIKNNKLGIATAKQLLQHNEFSIVNLIRDFHHLYENNEIIFLTY